MQTITFYGASNDIVTGSNYLLKDEDGYGIVVDMGMFQGNEALNDLNYQPLQFDAREVHSMLLTHAHLDHVGRLPMLTRHGFSGKIYATAATKALAEVVMFDSAKINASNEDKPLLYTEEDVYDTLSRFETIQYDQEFELGSAKITYKNAGHILGSASIVIDDRGKRIVFSGDLGNSPQLIEQPTQYIDSADVVIMESTYGDKAHPDEDPRTTITDEIKITENKNATLLIPSFSIERTQVLLNLIKHLKRDGKVRQDTVVYLDSPMAIKATDIYKSFRDLYSDALGKEADNSDPFNFPGLKVTELGRDSKKINKRAGAKIIIAGSGMMNGGRILHHAKQNLANHNTRLLIVGFQAENTLGRQIVDGAKSVEIDDREVDVNAHVTELYSMSAHADQPRLMKWLTHMTGVKKVYLTHGEGLQRTTLSEKIKADTEINDVELPTLNQTFDLSL